MKKLSLFAFAWLLMLSLVNGHAGSFSTGAIDTVARQNAATAQTTANAASMYLPPWTGGVATTVQAELAQTINVKNFGAACNGITDDSVAIQNALNYFTNGRTAIASGKLATPNGVCVISQTLIYAGAYGSTLTIAGSASGYGGGAQNGSVIRWNGAAGATMFQTMAANSLTLDHITFDLNNLARIGLHMAAENTTNTTLGTAVSAPGSVVVTPASMATIIVGQLLSVDAGSQVEYVYITAVAGSTFTATFTKTHLATAQLGGTVGSSTNYLNNVTATGVPAGTGDWNTTPLTASAGFVFGNLSSGGTSELADIHSTNIFSYGVGGPVASAGVAIIGNGNVKDFYFSHVSISNFHYGIDAPNSIGMLEVHQGNINNIDVGDLRLGGNGMTAYITGLEDESGYGHRFIEGKGSTGGFAQLTLIGNSWQSPAQADDYVIHQWQGQITLIGNTFFNMRTGSSIAKVQVVNPLDAATAAGAVTSIGNYYQNAVAGYAPFYDSSNNSLLPIYYAYQPVSVMSVNDVGGASLGSTVMLNNYVPTTALISQAATYVSGTGLVRAGDTDTAVAFRNHANSGDIVGLGKNTSDQVILGGSAGVIASIVTASTSYSLNGKLLASTTAPTIASGFGTSPSALTETNGSSTFKFTMGSGTPTAGVFALPAATNGWHCFIGDTLSNSFNVSATSTTTSASFSQLTAASAGHVMTGSCQSF